jgi:hypothetical protein
MSLREQQCRFTVLLVELLQWAHQQGYQIALKEVLRTVEQQRRYVAQKRSQTMASAHLHGLAVDLALFIDGEYQTTTEAYQPLGEYWEALDPACLWGGRWERFRDGNHFEVHFGRTAGEPAA